MRTEQHLDFQYGANTVYTEFHDGRVLRLAVQPPRPDDDAIPDALSAHMGIPAQHHPSPQRFDEHWRQLDV